MIWVHTVCLYAKSMFEKFARRCSRRHKQTSFSDAGFLGALRVKLFFQSSNQSIKLRQMCTKRRSWNYWGLILVYGYPILALNPNTVPATYSKTSNDLNSNGSFTVADSNSFFERLGNSSHRTKKKKKKQLKKKKKNN